MSGITNPVNLIDPTGKIAIVDDVVIVVGGTVLVFAYAEWVAWVNSPAGKETMANATKVVVNGITYVGAGIQAITNTIIDAGAWAGGKIVEGATWVGDKATALWDSVTSYFDKPDCDDEESEGQEKEHTPDSHPKEFTKKKNGQGYEEKKTGLIWKKDKLHKDHWDVSDSNGNKVKEVDFNGRQIWPNGPKNKNKR